MGTYLEPASWVSATWQTHRERNPPSSEPGTDYATPYGTPLGCAETGTVVDKKTSTSGGTGRYVTVDLDDGRRIRYLHLAGAFVDIGDRVGRGQIIAHTGASGHGSEWGYGAHVHVSLWARPGLPVGDTIDFQPHVGSPPSPPEPIPMSEDDMVYYLQALSSSPSGMVAGGYVYAYTPGQPIKLCSKQEWETVQFFNDRGFPVPRADWPGADIEQAIYSNGMFELSGGPGSPATGRVLFGPGLARFPNTYTVNPATLTDDQAQMIASRVDVAGRMAIWVGVAVGIAGVALLVVDVLQATLLY